MSVAQSWQLSRTAQFSARWSRSGTVITVHGELDAANAYQLASYVERKVMHSRRVMLDLRGVEFIGTAGFSALHHVNVACSRAQVQWAMVPSAAVSRLLRICDPDGTLPLTTPPPPRGVQRRLRSTGSEGEDSGPLLQLVP